MDIYWSNKGSSIYYYLLYIYKTTYKSISKLYLVMTLVDLLITYIGFFFFFLVYLIIYNVAFYEYWRNTLLCYVKKAEKKYTMNNKSTQRYCSSARNPFLPLSNPLVFIYITASSISDGAFFLFQRWKLI